MRALHVSLAAYRPSPWSVGAFVLSAVGVLAATWTIVGSESDPSQVRWPLVVAPLMVCLVPVLVPRQGTRIGALLALGGWCLLTGFSIGFTQWPALFASFIALQREAR